jgi:predicted nucleotide-binding protein
MRLTSKGKSLEMLKRLLEEGESLDAQSKDADWQTWERNVLIRIEAIFGKGSSQVREWKRLVQGQELVAAFAGREDKKPIIAALRSMVSEIQDLWSDEGIPPASSTTEDVEHPNQPVAPANKNVFVVHGHDQARMQAAARFIEKLGLNAIVLHEQASRGATIVEKLESHGDSAFAVVLLTPDDVGGIANEPNVLRPRARQNVVLELGYFMARLGRKRTCALLVKDVEIPSDYSGVVYIPIDDTDAWKFHLAREFKAAGLPIDTSKIL